MKPEYTNEEVREIVEVHRDGETLEDLEARMAGQWLTHCKEQGKDPVAVLRKAIEGLKAPNRD